MYGEASYTVALYLARIAAEWRWAHDVHVLYRLHEIEAAQPPAPAEEAEPWAEDPDDQEP
jgi:hypothetical protein